MSKQPSAGGPGDRAWWWRGRRTVTGLVVTAALGGGPLGNLPLGGRTAAAAAQTVHATVTTIGASLGASTAPAGSAGQAYSLLTAGGQLVGFGGAFSGQVAAPASPVVAVASTTDGHGAYAAEADGAVIALGDALYRGSMVGTRLARPVVGIAIDPATGGYWLVAADGGIFSFGTAPFLGSTGGIHLAQPIVGMAATPDGRGYRLVAADGGIFSFGDARFYGSTGGIALDRPVVGMAATPSGAGYWLVASDGGIFNYGDARFFGSTGGIHLDRPIIAMSPTTSGGGYWLVASDGGIFNYGDAPFLGSGRALSSPIVGMAVGSPGNYDDPLRSVSGLTPERVDEGVDYAGDGPIYALGDGVVLSTQGNWPDGTFITYRLSDGPAAGRIVYVAENVAPTVTVGQTVGVNTVVGILHDSYPDMEVGWAADQYGDTMAASAGQWSASDDSTSTPSAYGVNFNQLLVSLGAPAGVLEQPAVSGQVAAGWPTW
jgi:hypothetical protein